MVVLGPAGRGTRTGWLGVVQWVDITWENRCLTLRSRERIIARLQRFYDTRGAQDS
jgi:hypothetical protein